MVNVHHSIVIRSYNMEFVELIRDKDNIELIKAILKKNGTRDFFNGD